MENMKDKLIHVRIPEEILKQYRILCIQHNLSMPKMTTHIITSFCATLHHNSEFIKQKE